MCVLVCMQDMVLWACSGHTHTCMLLVSHLGLLRTRKKELQSATQSIPDHTMRRESQLWRDWVSLHYLFSRIFIQSPPCARCQGGWCRVNKTASLLTPCLHAITGDRTEGKQVIKQMKQRIQVAVSVIKETKQGQLTDHPARKEITTHHTWGDQKGFLRKQSWSQGLNFKDWVLLTSGICMFQEERTDCQEEIRPIPTTGGRPMRLQWRGELPEVPLERGIGARQ